MGNSIIPVLICILLVFENQINCQSMQRIAGHLLYRHGDRTPIKTFPLDPIKEADWPNGFGQLTVAGIEQHHRLGGYLRTRYGSLLSSTYNPKEIIVRSTDVDRTLMSAQSNIVGLYPVLNPTNDSVPIQPIPIHTTSINEDFLLGQNDCPRYDQVESEVDKSEEVTNWNKYYEEFFKQLEVWTNETKLTIYNAWDLADTVFVEHIYNRTPVWANEAVRQNLSDINDLAFHYLFANNDSKRIRGGPLVQDIWTNMNNFIQNKSSPWKVKMYSAHDTTVSAVLAFLGINYPHQPQYASALFIDLYQQNSAYFVKVEYLNVTDSNIPYPYVLDGCPEAYCPFEKFTQIYQPRFPKTADVECTRIQPPIPQGNDGKLTLVLVFVVIGLAVIVFIMFLCLHLRKTNRDPPLLGVDRTISTA